MKLPFSGATCGDCAKVSPDAVVVPGDSVSLPQTRRFFASLDPVPVLHRDRAVQLLLFRLRDRAEKVQPR